MLCELLLSAGADATAVNHDHETPADLCFLSGHATDPARPALGALLRSAAHWQTERLLWLANQDRGSLLQRMPPELVSLVVEKFHDHSFSDQIIQKS